MMWRYNEAEEGRNNVTAEECAYVYHLNGSTRDRCEFVRHNDDCNDFDGHINYIAGYFCFFGDYPYLCIPLYIGWMVNLFAALAVAADDFFVPNLTAISKNLRMSENIAGVTLLAFGNGAADVFSAAAGVAQKRPALVLGALFGAGTFLTSVVAGAVCVTAPFKVMERPFLRDAVFYLMAAFWAFYIFYKGQMHVYDSAGFLCLYLVYIVVVIVGRVINQRLRRRRRQMERLVQDMLDNESDVSGIVSSNVDNEEQNVNLVQQQQQRNEVTIFSTLNPIETVVFGDLPVYKKAWKLFRAPISLLLKLTIPTVDEDEPLRGWNRNLHVLQCYSMPIFVSIATNLAFKEVWNFPLIAVFLFIGQLAALAIMCTSQKESPPIYHPAAAYAGFISAMVWIYLIANEIVSLLKFFGILSGFSDAILGLTVLAWGNSVGDLASNVSAANKSTPRMGFSACFAGPLFNLLIGIGVPFSVAFARQDSLSPIDVGGDKMLVAMAAALATSLFTALATMTIWARFDAKRIHGCVLIGVYVVILAFELGYEFVII